MGGSSKSQSSQTSTSRTSVKDSRVGVESGGIGVGSGGTLSLNLTDAGIVKVTGDVLTTGLGQIGALGQAALDSAVGIIKDSNASIIARSETAGQDIAKFYVRSVSVVIVAVAVVLAFFGFKRSKK